MLSLLVVAVAVVVVAVAVAVAVIVVVVDVHINACHSSPTTVSARALQGSILGPILFSHY